MSVNLAALYSELGMSPKMLRREWLSSDTWHIGICVHEYVSILRICFWLRQAYLDGSGSSVDRVLIHCQRSCGKWWMVRSQPIKVPNKTERFRKMLYSVSHFWHLILFDTKTTSYIYYPNGAATIQHLSPEQRHLHNFPNDILLNWIERIVLKITF